MATRHSSTALTPTNYTFHLALFIILAVATEQGLASPPSTIEFYVHENRVPPNATRVVVASPSGDLTTATEFGTISVLANPIRETAAPNSTLIGLLVGQVITETGGQGTKWLSVTWKLNTTRFAGSVSGQGVGGEAIVGGTGDFAFVRGYAEGTFISGDPQDTVIRVVLHLKYD